MSNTEAAKNIRASVGGIDVNQEDSGRDLRLDNGEACEAIPRKTRLSISLRPGEYIKIGDSFIKNSGVSRCKIVIKSPETTRIIRRPSEDF